MEKKMKNKEINFKNKKSILKIYHFFILVCKTKRIYWETLPNWPFCWIKIGF